MPETAQCVRCGRITSTEFTEFMTWRVSDDGRAICPNCLTPSETVDDDTPVLTDNPDDRLCGFDPDNHNDNDTKAPSRFGRHSSPTR